MLFMIAGALAFSLIAAPFIMAYYGIVILARFPMLTLGVLILASVGLLVMALYTLWLPITVIAIFFVSMKDWRAHNLLLLIGSSVTVYFVGASLFPHEYYYSSITNPVIYIMWLWFSFVWPIFSVNIRIMMQWISR